MLLQMALFCSFLWLNNIPLFIHHIFFTNSSVDRHLGCFHVLAIANSAAVNIGVHIYSERTLILKDTCTPMFITALFMIAKTWKQCIYLFIFLILAALGLSSGMHAGSSSPTRDRIWAPCIRSPGSYTLDHQGSPKTWKQSKCPSTDEWIKKM